MNKFSLFPDGCVAKTLIDSILQDSTDILLRSVGYQEKNMMYVSVLLSLDLMVLLTSTRICSKLKKSDVLSTEVIHCVCYSTKM
jgi:hypothetical protein